MTEAAGQGFSSRRMGDARAGRFVSDLVSYGAVSLVALACDYGLLLALTAVGLHYLWASPVSFSVGIAVAYALSARFVFADRRDPVRLREMAGFVAVGLAGLLVTQLLLFVFVSRLSLDVALAKIPTTGCVFMFNFLARRSLIFIGESVPVL